MLQSVQKLVILQYAQKKFDPCNSESHPHDVFLGENAANASPISFGMRAIQQTTHTNFYHS